MKYAILYILILASLVTSCGTNKLEFNYKQFRKSNVLTSYKGMANEFQDHYLVLKENGYFKYYQKIWLFVMIKQGEHFGRYSQNKDTLYLNWYGIDPKQLKYYLSKKCVIDSTTKSIWFIDELTNERLSGLGLTSKNR